MDVDQPESAEEEAEATARDEIASLLGPAILSQFTVRARRDPEQREVRRLLLRYGDNGPESTALPLSPPDNMADVPPAVREAVRAMISRMDVPRPDL